MRMCPCPCPCACPCPCPCPCACRRGFVVVVAVVLVVLAFFAVVLAVLVLVAVVLEVLVVTVVLAVLVAFAVLCFSHPLPGRLKVFSSAADLQDRRDGERSCRWCHSGGITRGRARDCRPQNQTHRQSNTRGASWLDLVIRLVRSGNPPASTIVPLQCVSLQLFHH
jgi:hypothetical protein